MPPRRRPASAIEPRASDSTLHEPCSSNLFAVLGVGRAATQAELDAAFRSRAMKLHPDKGGRKEQFQQLQAAYELLSDEAKRRIYLRELVSQDSSDGQDKGARSLAAEPSTHVLADFPGEFVKVVLEVQPASWLELLHGMSESQLRGVLDVLSTEAFTAGRGRQPKCEGVEAETPQDLDLQGLQTLASGSYVVRLQRHGWFFQSRKIPCLAAAVLYHTSAIRLRKLLDEYTEKHPESSHAEVMKSGHRDWIRQNFACPLKFKFNLQRHIGSEKVSIPQVDDLHLALQFRQEALSATSRSMLRSLKQKWALQIKEHSEKKRALIQTRAQQLTGFVLRQLQHVQSAPSVRIRKMHKQAPDMSVEVPLHGAIATALGQTPQEIQRRLSSAQGQEALIRFLAQHTAQDPTASSKAWAALAADELQGNSEDDHVTVLRKVADLAKHDSCNVPIIPSSPALKDRFCLLDRLCKTDFDIVLSMLGDVDLARCRQVNRGFENAVLGSAWTLA